MSLGRQAPNGETVLVSYVRLGPQSDLEPTALKKFAATSLPAYMVPSAITILDTVPMNSNGKLDRDALPDPVFATGAYRPPRTEVEQVLVEVFADVLGAERVGVDDSFFELGATRSARCVWSRRCSRDSAGRCRCSGSSTTRHRPRSPRASTAAAGRRRTSWCGCVRGTVRNR
ncbi:hypothetical protein P9209_16690 [Prescottella defluvii]|nr:hypothetical protein P9209_16690 [Prescottella defluvii]